MSSQDDATFVGDATTPPWRQRAAAMWRYARWPVFAGAAVLVLLVLFGAWLWVTTDLPDADVAGNSAILVDRNGDELAVLAQDGLRIEVALDEIAPSVTDALVAAEDRRFFDHDGLDPVGLSRAVWNNLTNDSVQGGSTITQQLVKNLYLTNERTVTRKIREAVLSVKLEQSSSKEQILERYLNTAYFGRGAYGIEAAARTYYDTAAAELTPDRAALLVGILRAPEGLDPDEEADAARERRDSVLDAMAELGTLDVEAATAAKGAPIEVLPTSSPTTLSAGVAPHFVERVRQDIVEQFGEGALYDRGLVIHTTLDIADQQAAEASVAANLDDPSDPQAAVVGIDHTGAIRAWVGGKDFDELQVDLVSDDAGSGRQPGSTFKPIVLAANFEAGYGAGQRFPAPPEITLDIEPEPWTVSNAGGADYGTLTLLDGTVNSVNTVYAQALAQVGPQAVADLAEELGIGRALEPNPSIALGAAEVTPLELATVYSTFAREGSRVEPFRYTKVEARDGGVLWEMEEPEPVEVLEPNVANTVNAVLSETPIRGTATRAALDRPMAAKTGTTQNNADAWLAGYTPEYTAIVWIGYADGNQAMDTIDGERVQGGSIPAQIWHDFMIEALADVDPTEFGEPDQELLGDPTPDADLAVSPTSVEPGERILVTGEGFGRCVNGWQVALTGSGVSVESQLQPGSTETEREASLTVPVGASNGRYQVAALCDFGTGLQPFGPGAAVTVEDGTTTTSSPTSSTTTSSTTTTTELDGEDGGGNGGGGNTSTTTSTTTTIQPTS
ncbi:MAG: transglycosylase domain-containing protein [Acidimicrobiales bacterium]